MWALAFSGGQAAASVDDGGDVRRVATDAAEAVAEEQALARLAVSDGADVDGRLAAIDATGAALLAQLDRLTVELSTEVREVLKPLPSAALTDPSLIPTDATYRAAIADLVQIAATSDVITAIAPHQSGSSNVGVIVVAACALIVLGGIALMSALRNDGNDASLAKLAWIDPLTGLANRRRLDHDLSGLHHSGSRTNERSGDRTERSAAVIMVDIDHFKHVNDQLGHRAGDDVIRQVGHMLSQSVRIDDVVYRYGGEEFCVILPGADTAAAHRVAERIIAAARDLIAPSGLHITLSAGVADGLEHRVDATLAAADAALYVAKREGRDRVADAATPESAEPANASAPSA